MFEYDEEASSDFPLDAYKELEGEDGFSHNPLRIFDEEEENPPGDFTDLDSLLANALEESRLHAMGKVMREELRLSKDAQERERLFARIRTWEDKYEWNTTSRCVGFERIQCLCGVASHNFIGYYLHQTHKKIRHGKRWVLENESGLTPNTPTLKDLPCEALYRTRTVPICYSCAETKGFSLAQGNSL